MNISYTDHAQIRMSQRGITKHLVTQALQYGHCYHKQGYQFYVVRRKDMLQIAGTRRKDRLRNLTIVAKPDEGDVNLVIITAYRSDKAPHDIRRKSKKLLG